MFKSIALSVVPPLRRLQDQRNDLHAQTIGLQGRIDELWSQVAELVDRNAALAEQLASLTEQSAAQIAGLLSDNDALTEQLARLPEQSAAEVAGLLGSNAALTEQVTALSAQTAAAEAEKARLNKQLLDMSDRVLDLSMDKPWLNHTNSYLDRVAAVLQYREAYFEVYGKVAPGAALPSSHAWPMPDRDVSYKAKLTGHLDLAGRGAEIGPLNIPLLSKEESQVLYVDHLDTEGLCEKYPTLPDIVPVDLPMVNDSLADTLRPVAPLDYIVGSQVMEHVPNPIRWLQELSEVVRIGGLVSLSLPDRRLTFDLFREETRASEIVAAFLHDHTIPSVQSVYDNQSLATAINMHWAIPGSLYPDDVVIGRGAVSPPKAATNHLELTNLAKSGKYLDAHCWVFTPTSFLLVMAQLASDGFLPFKLHQFYPTNPMSSDRGSSSFTLVLERTSDGVTNKEKRRSFLVPLGD